MKFKKNLPKPVLITMYKAFVRPLLYYGDMKHKLEAIQHNSCLALSGATSQSLREKLMYADICCHHHELCLN